MTLPRTKPPSTGRTRSNNIPLKTGSPTTVFPILANANTDDHRSPKFPLKTTPLLLLERPRPMEKQETRKTTATEQLQLQTPTTTTTTELQQMITPLLTTPTTRGRILVASHTLPHTLALSPATGEWTVSPRNTGHTAMFAAIRAASHDEDILHIGWTGHITRADSADYYVDPDSRTFVKPADITEPMRADLSLKLSQDYRKIPLFLDDTVASGHYEGYCKSRLWPLFHYSMWEPSEDSKRERRAWDDYRTVNQAFADAVVAQYQPGDLIWLHDYHLLLVPSLIREKIPDAVIGFFLHTPFPSSEIFRCLPKRKEVLEGVLGANTIGFQTYSYARHFISSCTRVLGLESSPTGVEYNGQVVKIAIFPIGIDVERVEEKRDSTAVREKMEAIREMYPDMRIIVGRDKLDHVKGVQHKLNAFDKFLTIYPEWQNKVVLIQVTTPPIIKDSSKLESKVGELVSRINGNFGSLEYEPVHHYHAHLDQDDYFALLSIADVALITSVRDGMNTTSHEFVVCQKGNYAPLILSEFTGTSGSFSAAIMVNPFDYVGVASAINEALNMPKEDRLVKHTQLYNHVTRHSADFWAKSVLKDLKLTTSQYEYTPPLANTPSLDFVDVCKRYSESKCRLLLFDYDGTLTPIRKTPGAAVPQPDMLRALEKLVEDPRNHVYVISGRDQVFLERWLGHVKGLGLSAEHGCFIKYPESTSEDDWINLSEDTDLAWKQDVSEIFTYYTERTQGSFIEHKRASITWHYRLADPTYGIFQAKECQNHLENAVLSKLPLEILIGKKNLEVRPIAFNKGEIVKKLLARHPCDFCFCAGDDKTDEDMFRAIAKSGAVGSAVTCTIGPASKKTRAGFCVPSSDEIVRLMAGMAGMAWDGVVVVKVGGIGGR